MSEPKTELAKADERVMEYEPFGTDSKIKLSIAIIKNLVAVKTKSGKTCSDNDAIKFMMMCQARKLNPFEQDCWLIGYDSKEGPTFTMITAHQAFLKRAELHHEYNGMKSGVIVKRGEQLMDLEGDFFLEGDKLLGGWATVYFKTREHPMNKRVRLERFRKSFGIWLEDPAGMICKVAEADALRSSFPTMLGGLYLREEQGHNDAKVSTPIFKANPATVEVESKPEPTPLEKVQTLIIRDGVKESDLIEFLKVIGMIGDDVEYVGDVDNQVLDMVVEEWPKFLTKIKEATSETDQRS